MAERDPSALGGNAVATGEARFGKASDGLTGEQKAGIRHTVAAAGKAMRASAKTEEHILYDDRKRNYFIATEHVGVAANRRTTILDVPASVEYRSSSIKVHCGMPGADGGGYDLETGRSSILTVQLHDSEKEATLFSFDFDTPDPAEAVAAIAQNTTIGGEPVGVDEGSARVLQVIEEAAQALQAGV